MQTITLTAWQTLNCNERLGRLTVTAGSVVGTLEVAGDEIKGHTLVYLTNGLAVAVRESAEDVWKAVEKTLYVCG